MILKVSIDNEKGFSYIENCKNLKVKNIDRLSFFENLGSNNCAKTEEEEFKENQSIGLERILMIIKNRYDYYFKDTGKEKKSYDLVVEDIINGLFAYSLNVYNLKKDDFEDIEFLVKMSLGFNNSFKGCGIDFVSELSKNKYINLIEFETINNNTIEKNRIITLFKKVYILNDNGQTIDIIKYK